MKGFTVLLYHRIHPRYGIHPKVFRKQMEFLKSKFNILKLGDIENSPFPSVLITFDDGFYDVFYYAYPILKELSIPAVVFVPPERILNSDDVRNEKDYANISTYEAFKRSFLLGNNSAFLSWGELRKMNDIFSIQSHALTHKAHLGKGKPYKFNNDWRIYSLPKDLRYRVKQGVQLTSILMNRAEAKIELIESRKILEKRIGKPVNAVAWPWGIYNEELVKMAKDLGYKYCFTTKRGWNRHKLCNIRRLAVSEKKGMFWFITRSFIYSF